MNNPNKPRKVRRLTKAEIIKAKERYRDMWASNRARMLKLAELGRKAISAKHDEHRLWMRQWLAKSPSHFSREQLRRMIDRDRAEGDTAKTESYVKTMIRYGYIKFDDSTMLWENMYFKL